MKKIAALIQARMCSSRLPRKALLNIDGLPSIGRVVQSLKLSKRIEGIIIATGVDKGDDAIEELAKEMGVICFRGDNNNIAKRFLDASQLHDVGVIVRVTGDCPVVSYEIADYLINNHLNGRYDYSAIETDKVPIGVSSEVISVEALKKLFNYKIDFEYSEYLSFYFTYNPSIFSINIIPALKPHISPSYRVTLDYKEDLDMLNKLYKKMREEKIVFSLTNVIDTLRRYPEITALNSHLGLKYKSNRELAERIRKAAKIDIK